MSDDPFLQVQADVLSLLDTTRPLFTSYIRIRSSAASPSNPQLVEAREELESNLSDLSTDLQDLIDSVKAVEGDPYKYGIDIDEVSRRRRLVQDIGAEIEDMHQQLNQTVSKAPLAHPDSFGAAEGDEDDDEYGQFQEQRQMEMMRDQDQALDGVFQTVGNLRMQADTMGRELEEQADMLDDVDNITERVGGKLQTGMKKINFVIRQNEGKHAVLEVKDDFLADQTTLRHLVKLLYWCLDLRSDHLTGHSPYCMSSSCLRHHSTATAKRRRIPSVEGWRHRDSSNQQTPPRAQPEDARRQ